MIWVIFAGTLLFMELENQQQWMSEEEQEFGTTDHRTRENIIDECESLRNNLEEKGYEKYYKYY